MVDNAARQELNGSSQGASGLVIVNAGDWCRTSSGAETRIRAKAQTPTHIWARILTWTLIRTADAGALVPLRHRMIGR